mmetsp:Transcript_15989/g.23169  ORF Transcript_15989/g.23169 Transcript_15989/m.23169 type:complete len:317 (-) Transcript_15989:80-1030(-)
MSSEKKTSARKIKFLSLNIFLRPPPIKTNGSDYKDLRTLYFCKHLMKKYDIICLQECFDSYSLRRKKIIHEGKHLNFQYHAVSPDPRWYDPHLIDGGLLILSKYRILNQEFLPFEHEVFPDSVAYKGILYAKILIQGKNLHLFTTHLQSKHPTSNPDKYLEYREVRRAQVVQLREFIDSKIGDSNEPVVVAGDLNIDGRETLKPPVFTEIECMDDYQKFMEIMTKKNNLTDILRKKYGESPSTFGRVHEGEPLEVVLTHPEEVFWDESLDYILVENETKGFRVDWNETRVNPLETPGEVFTQVSDHAGVQTAFIID